MTKLEELIIKFSHMKKHKVKTKTVLKIVKL